MALQEEWRTIQFQDGIDSETNAKTVVPGTLTDLQNGTFAERITIVKRPGTQTLSRRVASQTGYVMLSGALGLASRGGGPMGTGDDATDLVLLSTDDGIHSHDQALDQWVRRGDWPSMTLSLESPARGPNEGWDATACSSGSVQLWAWEDLRGGVYGRMRNLRTGVAYGPEFRIGGSTGRSPVALAGGSSLHVYFVRGTVNTLNVAVFNPSNPTSTSASLVQLNSSLFASNPTFAVDAAPGASTARIAISISGSTRLAVVREDGVLGSVSSTPPYPNPVDIYGSVIAPDIAVSRDGLRMAVVRKSEVRENRFIVLQTFDATTFAPLTGSSVDTGGSTDTAVDSVGCAFYGPGSGTLVGVFSSFSASLPQNRFVRFVSVDASPVPYRIQTSGTVLIRHTDMASKPFALGDRCYFWGTQVSDRQTTDFLIRDDGQVHGVSRYSTAFPVVSSSLGRVEVRSDMSGVMARRAVTTRDQFVAVSGGLSAFGDRHPGLQTISYHPSSSWRPVDVGGVLYMPGGFLGKYDGSSVTENGFLLQVEGLSAAASSSSLGTGLGILSSVGTTTGPIATTGANSSVPFSYEVLPVAYDAQGNEEVGSCVSILNTVLSASANGVQNTNTLTWQSIAHTRRDGINAPDIRFKVFRTGFFNGIPLTTRQRVDDPTRPIVNLTGSDTITFTDTTPHSVQSLGEISPTTTTPNNAPTPACEFMCGAGDRLYLAGIEGAPVDVIPSKLRLGGPIAFADGASFSVDAQGGPITGIGAIDQDIAIFKATRVWHTVAAGPDNTLTDTTPYPIPEMIASDVGAPRPSTIVQVAGTSPDTQGLAFSSARGIRLLQRGISLADIGSRMRGFEHMPIVAGLSPSNSEEIRLYSSEGITQVLNTRYGKWSTFPDQTAVAACTWQGAAAYTDSDGRVRVERPGTWLDNSNPYSLSMTTGWLPLQGLQGLSRVRRLLLLGDFHSHHRLRVEMAVDYRDSWRIVREIDTRTSLGVIPYGGSQATVSSSVGAAAYRDLGVDFLGVPVPGDEYLPTVRCIHTGSFGNSVTARLSVGGPEIPVSGILFESASGLLSDFVYPTGGATTIDQYEAAIGNGTILAIASGTTESGHLLPNFPSGTVAFSRPLSNGYDGSSNAPSGSSDPYGDGAYGGSDPVYQMEFRLPIERFQTVRFRFSDLDQDVSDSSAQPGRSYSLTEMRLLVSRDTARPNGLPTRKVR